MSPPSAYGFDVSARNETWLPIIHVTTGPVRARSAALTVHPSSNQNHRVWCGAHRLRVVARGCRPNLCVCIVSPPEGLLGIRLPRQGAGDVRRTDAMSDMKHHSGSDPGEAPCAHTAQRHPAGLLVELDLDEE